MIGKSKKLLVPVIAIMMCAIALAGVAYAATTTVSNNGSASSDVFTIDLYTNEGATTVQSVAYTVSGYTFYTTKAVSGNLNVLTDPVAATTIGYVAVKDGTGVIDSTITPSIATAEGYTGDFALVDGALKATFHGTVVTVSVGITEVGQTDVYAVGLTIATSGNSSYDGADANAAAKEVMTAVNGLTFTLTFSATSS